MKEAGSWVVSRPWYKNLLHDHPEKQEIFF